MKHHLSLLCFALTLFLYVNETVANLLLKQNPTPLEPASYASSGESYQLAKVTWLPDYLGNNKSYGVNRTNDGGKEISNRKCEIYGLVDSCPEHSISRGVVHPIAGLTCYKECICDTSYYRYYPSNCYAPKILGGESCTIVTEDMIGRTSSTEYYSECIYPNEYNLSSCPTNGNCEACINWYKLVTCKKGHTKQNDTCINDCSDYSLTSCPTNATCDQCDNKYKQTGCKDGYSDQNGTCVKNEDCSAYPLTVCPMGGTCSDCPDNSAKKKLDGCDTAKGWNQANGTCDAVGCPTGYTAGVTTCTSGSTKPDISLSGWSGGQQCGLCKCNSVDNTCTEASYPLVSAPVNTNYESCTTGCGSEKVTRYKVTTCKNGYKMVNDTCKNDICTSGSKDITCTNIQNKVVITTTEAGSTCYQCVNKDDTCPSGYSKTACTSSQKQTGTSTTEAGSTCYKCENIVEDNDEPYQVCIDSTGNLSNKNTLGVSECCLMVAEDYCEEEGSIYNDSILYTDGTICSNLVKNKSPLAVVLTDDYSVAVGIDSMTRTNSIYWSKATQNGGGSTISSVKADDCSLTKEIKERGTASSCR